MTESLVGLLARVEGAAGPDRELDALVHAALEVLPAGQDYPSVAPDTTVTWGGGEDGWVRLYATNGLVNNQHIMGRSADRLTASLDAALTLVERVRSGHIWSVGADIKGTFYANLWAPQPAVVLQTARAATPALALLAALLRALISQEGEGGT